MAKEIPDNTGKNQGKVGYKNPPKHTQFKKGHSGNLKGKPKGSFSLITLLKRGLQEIVQDQKGEKKQRVEIFVRNILYKAINEGDKDMIKLIFQYVEGMPKQAVDLNTETESKQLEEISNALKAITETKYDESETENKKSNE